MTQTFASFSPEDMHLLAPFMKIGLLATVTPEGLPHLTFISSMRPNTPTQLTWGQFVEGTSKQFIRQNPKVGFLMMTLQKELWRGKATFTHTASQGPEYDFYNNVPMFRYNAYFGIHTVYYMNLVHHLGRQPLPMNKIIPAAILTMLAKSLAPGRAEHDPLNLWTRSLLNKLDALKFLAYVDRDGYPVIVPVIQAQAAGREHVLFSTGAYGADLGAVPAGTKVAVFGLALTMEDVLMRGEFEGIKRYGGIRCGRVKVDWVYNSMPPAPRQIYPEVPLEPVTTF
ncbi:MAG: hypothetical protein HY781_05995 [Chloroflexi bacterium]|nr:hypothetical protein [Chloroflexota bacterium]